MKNDTQLKKNGNKQQILPRVFTPLAEPLSKNFQELYDNQMITLPKIRSKNSNAKRKQCYNEHEFCNYHRQRGHDTNTCKNLKHIIQDLIDNEDLEVDITRC